MNYRFLAVILFSMSWPGPFLAGQTSYHLRGPESGSLILPFELAQNLIIIPARINNSSNLKLVLDSGISNTIITGLTDADTIPLNTARKIKVGGLGDGTPIEAYYSRGNQLEITHPEDSTQGIWGDKMDIYVLTTDQFELSGQLGIRVNGLVGSDLFENFLLGIETVKKEITFHNREKFNFKKGTRNFKKIPLTIINGKAYIEMLMLQENDSALKVKLLIDTGASLSFWIAPIADHSIVIPGKTVRSLIGQGLNGPITGVIGRVKTAAIGPFVFKNPIVSYPDSSSVAGLPLNEERHGSLGNDILRRFSVIFDFKGSAIYLKPNKWIKSPFLYNRSGMDVEKLDPLIPVYSIFSVIPESPADRAGLQPDDLIESINYIPALNLSLDDINDILYGNSGRCLILKVNRNGEKLKVKFQLDRKI